MLIKYAFAFPSGKSHPPAPDFSDDGDEAEQQNFLLQHVVWFNNLPMRLQVAVARNL